MTPDTARRLGKLFAMSPEFWMSLHTASADSRIRSQSNPISFRSSNQHIV
jgi:plasmid maintenance system antidote protein VapI